MKDRKTFILIAVCAALAGYSLFATVASYYVVRTFEGNNAVVALTRILNASGLFTYGTVTSYDDNSSVLTFSSRSPATGEMRQISVIVTDQTHIQQETLQTDASGTYVGLSPLSAGTISDLTPGTRIAVAFVPSGNDLLATYILFGDPL